MESTPDPSPAVRRDLPAFITRPPRASEPAPETPWYALRTRPNRELQVTALLTALPRVTDVFCPTYLASWVTRGRLRERVVPYLSTYVFARWSVPRFTTRRPPVFATVDRPASVDPHRTSLDLLNDEAATLWHLVNDLDGVTAILGGATPTPIHPREITALRALLADNPADLTTAPNTASDPNLRPGTPVAIVAGPFRGRRGIVTAVNGPITGVKIPGLLLRDTVLSLQTSWVSATPDPTPGSKHSATSSPPRPRDGEPLTSGETARSKRKRGQRGGSFKSRSAPR